MGRGNVSSHLFAMSALSTDDDAVPQIVPDPAYPEVLEGGGRKEAEEARVKAMAPKSPFPLFVASTSLVNKNQFTIGDANEQRRQCEKGGGWPCKVNLENQRSKRCNTCAKRRVACSWPEDESEVNLQVPPHPLKRRKVGNLFPKAEAQSECYPSQTTADLHRDMSRQTIALENFAEQFQQLNELVSNILTTTLHLAKVIENIERGLRRAGWTVEPDPVA